MQRFEYSTEYGYTGAAGELGIAFPLPRPANVDPATTEVPVFVVYPLASNPGTFGQRVASIKQAAPGTNDTFFPVTDYAKSLGVVTQ